MYECKCTSIFNAIYVVMRNIIILYLFISSSHLFLVTFLVNFLASLHLIICEFTFFCLDIIFVNVQ